MEGSKWVAAVASIWIQCSCGASYTFGIYSPILKSSQGYDQSTLDTISVFKDIGANVGVLAGLFYSAVVRRRLHGPPSFWRQPWLVHAVGAVLCFVGYFYLWLAVTGAIPRPPVAVTCFFIFVAAQALTFFNTSNIVTSVQNFPAYGGTIVGIMKGFLGLSAAILIQVYQTFFGGNASAFLLMLAVVSPLFSLFLMFFVRVHDAPSKGDEDKRHLNGFSLIAIIVAAYIMLLIIADNVLDLPQSLHALAFAVLVIILSSPLSVAIKAYVERRASSSSFPTLEAPLIKDDTKADDDHKTNDEASVIVDLDAVEDLNVVQAMRTLNFWLLFIAMFCAMGSGLATINNITQMGESLGYAPRERNTLVSLWSIWNFLGRFVAGYVSDVFLHKKGLARTFFMPVTLATMTVGHLIISSGVSGNLYIGSVLVGICFGSQWSLMPTITSEIFGLTHMGTIFNTIAVASPLGSYILSVRVIGYLYDKEAGGMGDSCIGIHCFRTSFFILASVSVVGFMVSLVFLARTRAIYARIVRRRMWT